MTSNLRVNCPRVGLEFKILDIFRIVFVYFFLLWMYSNLKTMFYLWLISVSDIGPKDSVSQDGARS